MTRKYPYYPSFDGGAAGAGTLKFVELCTKRWKGTKNLGIYQVRLMRNDKTKNMKIGDAGYEKFLSVHATGAACDVGYPNRKVGVQMWDWFITYTKELGIVEIHDYAFDANVKDKQMGYGRGFRCSRGEGLSGVKVFTASDNAGSFGGQWLHVELEPEMAKDAAKLEAAWRSLPKPPPLD